ncbi:o-succinylbenzoate synthase [Kibdelosporangium phytohabitans]|uniref:o-succinylbenzoate synthase n=1 Tax=Kibdelosporangium phytohabitans TaxID=860235 RepID=A0A0N9I4P8_9PSEU|nr:o-succinylbenzoate synthase [Kibdelosporangium phytohabitans]ALG09350.1 o-succinylbenzoate synthase [Kibdelosporangium phytohabitans]MBE1469384.1 O-succinylbenzoate synthase [Kibdelosporangium phytohabitans]
MTGARVELHTARMPLVRPFRTSRAVETARELVLLRWIGPDGEGWSECAADPAPIFFGEYLEGTKHVIEHVLLPLLATGEPITAAYAHETMRQVPGNVLAKAAVETAILDAELRARGMPLVDYLGGVRKPIPVGVSVGIATGVPELLEWVAGYLDDGYRRVKLKIRPGWDLEPVAAVRRAFGDDLLLQVDANQAYGTGDTHVLRALDEFGLLLLEQPFAAGDLVAHARLAGRITTPVCLDESITGLASTATALALGAADVVNIKPARVGGYLEARAIHDLCRAQGVPVFCGGVLETGVGRAANLALAALPGFTLPADISATSRYYTNDITQPFELADGCIEVPAGPGSGAVVDRGALESVTTDVRTMELREEP